MHYAVYSNILNPIFINPGRIHYNKISFSIQEKVIKNGFCENVAWANCVPSRRSCRVCPLCRYVEKRSYITRPNNWMYLYQTPFHLCNFFFILFLWHSVGRWDFSLNGRPGRDEEVKQYLWKRFGIPFSQIRFQHHPLFCHIIWTPLWNRDQTILNLWKHCCGIAYSDICSIVKTGTEKSRRWQKTSKYVKEVFYEYYGYYIWIIHYFVITKEKYSSSSKVSF